jgi:hypothetical protein
MKNIFAKCRAFYHEQKATLKLMGIGLLACVVLLAVGSGLRSRQTPQEAEMYVCLRGDDYFLLRADGTQLHFMSDDGTTGRTDFFRFSSNRKYVYFWRNVKEHDNGMSTYYTGTLYRAEVAKLTGNPDRDRAHIKEIQKDSTCYGLTFVDDGDRGFVYMDGRKLMYYNGTRHICIADKVEDCHINGSKICYWTWNSRTYGDYNLYVVSVQNPEYSTLLAEHVEPYVRGDAVWYKKKTGDSYTYYAYNFGQTSKKLFAYDWIDRFGDAGAYVTYLVRTGTTEVDGKSIDVYDLRLYKNGRTKTLLKNVAGGSSWSGIFTVDQLEKWGNLSGTEFVSGVPYYYLDVERETVVQLSEQAAAYLGGFYNSTSSDKSYENYVSLLLLTDRYCYMKVNRNLMVASVKNNTVGKFTVLERNIWDDRADTDRDVVYYASKDKEGYFTRDDNGTVVSFPDVEDISPIPQVCADGSLIAYTNGRSQITWYEPDGRIRFQINGLTYARKTADDTLLCITGGKLCKFTGTRKVVLTENVNAVWKA